MKALDTYQKLCLNELIVITGNRLDEIEAALADEQFTPKPGSTREQQLTDLQRELHTHIAKLDTLIHETLMQ